MKPLRLLQLDSGTEWRGGQRQVLLLARGLKDLGHRPFLIAAPRSPLATRAHAAGLAVSTVLMRADWDIRAARKLRTRIRAWQPDVVHAHDARSHAIALLALLGIPGVPLVVTRRVQFSPKARRLKYGERVARFIAVSRAVRDALVASGVEPSRVDVVYSGIPAPQSVVPRDWRAHCNWPADVVVCGIIGAMTREKGLDQLRLIRAHMSDGVARRVRLVLMGYGETLDWVDSSGFEVCYAGFVEDIATAAAGLDVLWHPSRSEGLGTALLDAMAAGVAPVAFAAGGIPEVVHDEVSGLLVSRGDAAAFATAAERLICEPELRRELSEGARLRAAAFTDIAMTNGTVQVYHRVLEGST